jgi:pimeloyl-ACP methyl ester carboxylesterase
VHLSYSSFAVPENLYNPELFLLLMKKIMCAILALIILASLLLMISCKNNNHQNNQNQTNNTNSSNTELSYSNKYPILIVHGWMGKAIDYGDYEAQLQKDMIAMAKGVIEPSSDISICPDKWPVTVVVSAEYYSEQNKNQGIAAYAKELNHVVELVRNCTGQDQVILLAHSMGGLVSRKYMADFGNEHVTKLITLGTPHYGFNDFTRAEIILMMLHLFTGRDIDVEQMMPESDFLMALDKADISYRNKIVSIGTYSTMNSTLVFGLPIFQSEIKNFENQFFNNTDIIVKLDSTKLSGSKYYQVEGCSHTEILDFRAVYPKGPINNPKTCPDAYEIVKKEIVAS